MSTGLTHVQKQDAPIGEERSDEALMALFCKDLQDDVFHILASRHYDKALRIAMLRLGCASKAQDAVQETFIRVVRHRERYNPEQPFAQWFYTILRHVCTDIHRKESRYAEVLDKYAGWTLTSSQDVALDEAGVKLSDVARGLTESDAQLLSLRYIDGLSFSELSKQLRCSVEAAKKRIQRLLKRIKP